MLAERQKERAQYHYTVLSTFSINKEEYYYETKRDNTLVAQGTRDGNLDLVINNAVAILAHPPSGYRP